MNAALTHMNAASALIRDEFMNATSACVTRRYGLDLGKRAKTGYGDRSARRTDVPGLSQGNADDLG